MLAISRPANKHSVHKASHGRHFKFNFQPTKLLATSLLTVFRQFHACGQCLVFHALSCWWIDWLANIQYTHILYKSSHGSLTYLLTCTQLTQTNLNIRCISVYAYILRLCMLNLSAWLQTFLTTSNEAVYTKQICPSTFPTLPKYLPLTVVLSLPSRLP